MARRLLVVTALYFSAVAISPAADAAGHRPARPAPGYTLSVNGQPIDAKLTSAFIKPGVPIKIAVDGLSKKAEITVEAARKSLAIRRTGPQHWQIAAPGPGIYRLSLHGRSRKSGAGFTRMLNLFVMQRFDPKNTAINGYRIGHYEDKALRGRAIYEPPTALMPVEKDQLGVHVSRHFTIGQFLCGGQAGQWPKYLRLRPTLLAKLEAILAALNEKGIAADTLHVMSGYRTPAYNKAIGNTTSYSRHLYGGAADIYVDTDHDGRMDDLDGNGQIDVADAKWLAALITKLDAKHPAFAGGLSAYSANAAHGPFVHTDVRGIAVRW